MACLLIDSCGAHYDVVGASQKWDAFNDIVISADGAGFLGGRCWVSGVTPYTQVRGVARVAPSPINEIYWGFRFLYQGGFPLSPTYTYYVLSAVHDNAANFSISSTKQFSVNVLHDGKLEVRRGDVSGVVLGTTTKNVLDTGGVWTNIGVHVVISPTAGLVEIRQDGVTVLLQSGLNTQGRPTNVIGGIEYVPWQLDDLWINDPSGTDPRTATFMPGAFHVQALWPVADAGVQWTPTAAPNVANVDDRPAHDAMATTVRAASPGLTDLYQLETMEPGSVIAIQGNAYALCTGTATFAHCVQIGGVTYVGTVRSVMPIGMRDVREVWPLAPDDGLPWTAAKVNAARWGFTRI